MQIAEQRKKALRVYQEFPEGQHLKVLSLFFIDHVAKSVETHRNLRKWFEESYTKWAQNPRDAVLESPPVKVIIHHGPTMGGAHRK